MSSFFNDPENEQATGFAKVIATEIGVNIGDSIPINMLIPTGGAAVCMYETPDLTHAPTANATGDIRVINDQYFIIVYGSGTVTFSDSDGENPK